MTDSRETTELSPFFDDDDDDTNENLYERQILKLTSVASVSSIVANVLISVTIIKFKNLRRELSNRIILHLAVLQIINAVLDQIVLWFFTDFGTPLPQYDAEFCVMFVGVRMLNAIFYLIVILLVCNWYFKLFCNESKYSRFCKCYKFFLVLIYFTAFFIFPFLTKLCFKFRDVFVAFFVVLSFQVLMIIFTLYMNVVNKYRNRQSYGSDSGLGVANITIVFSTPAYIFLILAYYNFVPVYIVLFGDFFATGLFPFVVLYLYKNDRNFQMYFKKIMACHTHDSENESVSYNLINETGS